MGATDRRPTDDRNTLLSFRSPHGQCPRIQGISRPALHNADIPRRGNPLLRQRGVIANQNLIAQTDGASAAPTVSLQRRSTRTYPSHGEKEGPARMRCRLACYTCQFGYACREMTDIPASTDSTCPVIQRASSLARNRAALPTSHAVPSVPSIVEFRRCCLISASSRYSTIGVKTTPGATQFTRIPSRP